MMAGLLAILLIIFLFFDRQFKLSNVKGNWPLVESSQITAKQQLHLQQVFSQPFLYLDRGKQSFVFISQDQRYVVKFFDNRCLRSGMLSFFSQSKRRNAKKNWPNFLTDMKQLPLLILSMLVCFFCSLFQIRLIVFTLMSLTVLGFVMRSILLKCHL